MSSEPDGKFHDPFDPVKASGKARDVVQYLKSGSMWGRVTPGSLPVLSRTTSTIGTLSTGRAEAHRLRSRGPLLIAVASASSHELMPNMEYAVGHHRHMHGLGLKCKCGAGCREIRLLLYIKIRGRAEKRGLHLLASMTQWRVKERTRGWLMRW